MSAGADLAALRQTAEAYARGADRRDKDLWRAVLTHDIELSGPHFATSGLEAVLGSIDMLGQMFTGTRHIIHDQVAEITGDTAQGETRCTAEHRVAREGGDRLVVWAIRYQDGWRREGGTWKFARRHLIIDWEEVRPCHDVGDRA